MITNDSSVKAFLESNEVKSDAHDAQLVLEANLVAERLQSLELAGETMDEVSAASVARVTAVVGIVLMGFPAARG